MIYCQLNTVNNITWHPYLLTFSKILWILSYTYYRCHFAIGIVMLTMCYIPLTELYVVINGTVTANIQFVMCVRVLHVFYSHWLSQPALGLGHVNYIMIKGWGAIIHPFSNFSNGSIKPLLRFGQDRLIASHIKIGMWLLTRALITGNLCLITVPQVVNR